MCVVINTIGVASSYGARLPKKGREAITRSAECGKILRGRRATDHRDLAKLKTPHGRSGSQRQEHVPTRELASTTTRDTTTAFPENCHIDT